MGSAIKLVEKLGLIQAECKVPKNMYNSFGGFNYRSAESILETVKPIALAHRATIICDDRLVREGERYYIEATAYLLDFDSEDMISVKGYAREPEQKKGMDSSQVTGATSSYARKYALNGLLDLDDNKDADTDEYTRQTTSKKTITKGQLNQLMEKAKAVFGEKASEELPNIIRELGLGDKGYKRYGELEVEDYNLVMEAIDERSGDKPPFA